MKIPVISTGESHGPAFYCNLLPIFTMEGNVTFQFVVYLLSPVLPFCDPLDCSPPGSSACGLSQARTLEWVAVSFSGGSSRPTERTHISCVGRRILYPDHPFFYLHTFSSSCPRQNSPHRSVKRGLEGPSSSPEPSSPRAQTFLCTRAQKLLAVQGLPTAGNGTNLWTRRRVAGVNLLAF